MTASARASVGASRRSGSSSSARLRDRASRVCTPWPMPHARADGEIERNAFEGVPGVLPQPRALRAGHGPRDRPARARRDRGLRPGRLERLERRRALVRGHLLRRSRPPPARHRPAAARLVGGAPARAGRGRRAGRRGALDRPRRLDVVQPRRRAVGGDVLLGAAGYEPFRQFYSMRRPDLDDIPDLRCPDGLEIRPIPNDAGRDPGGRSRRQRGLPDHFGSVDDEDACSPRSSSDPETDTSLWVVAFDGDEIAGARPERDPRGPRRRPGRLARLGLHPPAVAPRGLARALIARSLVAPPRARRLQRGPRRRRRRTRTRPSRLYESCGFRRRLELDRYRKPLPSVPSSPDRTRTRTRGGRAMIDTTDRRCPTPRRSPGLRFRPFDPARDYPASST